jgi:dienelactone hydrolase
MIKTRELEYFDETTLCRAFVAYPEVPHTKLPAPAVLIGHNWRGRGSFFCEKAVKLAEMGYVGFALDMYGEAKCGETNEEKMALLTPFKEDRALLIRRVQAAFYCLRNLPEVDPRKIAAMGYCFGGMCVLDLARSVVDIKGIISFHGILTPPDHLALDKINAKILILHGYDDPLVPPDEIDKFAAEMTNRQADWQLHAYGLVKHSFTDPEANDNTMGLHYNKNADERSWKNLELFLNECCPL